MDLRLFDAQAGFGGAIAGKPVAADCSEYVREMAFLNIERALVRTVPDDLTNDFEAANARLYADCAENPALSPCPILAPNGACDLASEAEQVAHAISQGAGAAFLRPQGDCWGLASWSCGALFDALEERCLPAFCEEGKFTLEQIADLAGRYPQLPIILAELQYRCLRDLVPLLRTFPNIYLSIGRNFTIHRGIELLVARVGAERLVFGTGFPRVEPMSAITQLTYADIPPEAKGMIGAGNMERLMEGIVR
jgi:Amidohydrolase